MRLLMPAALVGLLLAVPCAATSAGAAAPSGGRIAFVQTGIVSRDNGEIFVVDARGRGLRNLTRNPRSDERGYRWSPDGRKIVFASQRPAPRSGTWWENLHVMNADGSRQRRLTNTYWNGEAVWAPDGRRIAFIRNLLDPPRNSTGDTTSEIYVMNADGTHQRRLTRNALDEHGVSWSKTGRLAFSRAPRLEPTAYTGSEIWAMNPNGVGAVRLTQNHVQDETPVWSPDGRRIALIRCEEPARSCSIWLMNGDGGEQRQLTRAFDEAPYPVWSPDGKKIAFTARRSDLYVADADGSQVRRLTTGGKDRVLAPTWSPDGRKIVFHRYPCLHVINADGTGKRRLLPRPGRPPFSAGECWRPSWSPSG